MNKLYQQLNQSTSQQFNNINLSQIKKMMKMVRTASDPKLALQEAVEQNPQMKQVMDLVQRCGGDPKSAFYKLAEEKGVDPE